MRRLKSACLPYFSDAIAFALLGMTLAIVIGGSLSGMSANTEPVRHYQSYRSAG